MTSHSFNIGAVEYLDQSGAEADSIEKNIAGEKMYQWTGNVGLANVSDILRASTNHYVHQPQLHIVIMMHVIVITY